MGYFNELNFYPSKKSELIMGNLGFSALKEFLLKGVAVFFLIVYFNLPGFSFLDKGWKLVGF